MPPDDRGKFAGQVAQPVNRMPKISDYLRKEFNNAAKTRGDAPAQALERLMLEYVRQDRTIAELFAKAGRPANSLREYDPADDRPLGREAAKGLIDHANDVEIDPADVTDEHLPQSREVKREVILGVVRYRQSRRDGAGDLRHENIIHRDDVVAAAEEVVGALDTSYKKNEYVEQVMDELMVRNPFYDQLALLSPADAMEYLDSLPIGESLEAENDLYNLSETLIADHRNEIDIDRLNKIRDRHSFSPIE